MEIPETEKPILPTIIFSVENNKNTLDIENSRKLAEFFLLLKSYIEKLEYRIKLNNELAKKEVK